jgi:hypothetical protein
MGGGFLLKREARETELRKNVLFWRVKLRDNSLRLRRWGGTSKDFLKLTLKSWHTKIVKEPKSNLGLEMFSYYLPDKILSQVDVVNSSTKLGFLTSVT